MRLLVEASGFKWIRGEMELRQTKLTEVEGVELKDGEHQTFFPNISRFRVSVLMLVSGLNFSVQIFSTSYDQTMTGSKRLSELWRRWKE